MLLTLTATASEVLADARDLGFLLHKNPATLFEKELPFGTARLFYPEAASTRCSAALWVQVDPISLVRGPGALLSQYVSDRPYALSSFLSVALASCFASALGGRSKERPELAATSIPLTATLQALVCDAGEGLIRALFEPLGYAVAVARLPLEERFPEWGASDLYTVTLSATTTVKDLLSHLYVLVPVLDNAKHYAFGDDEVDKLLRHGADWLPAHPAREVITRRYLRYRRRLMADAMARLAQTEETPEEDSETVEGRDAAEKTLEQPVRLNDRRLQAAVAAVESLSPAARSVVDLGCGEGKTLVALRKAIPTLERLTGMDVSTLALERAARTLHPERHPAKIQLIHGSLVYRDQRLAGHDVALLTEVIEHLDPPRLASLERVVFEHARPRRAIVTTPNAEYNTIWESLPAGKFRHRDHRFEWTRAEFQSWAEGVAERHGYAVAFSGVGDEDTEGRGTPTQMAVFDGGISR